MPSFTGKLSCPYCGYSYGGVQLKSTDDQKLPVNIPPTAPAICDQCGEVSMFDAVRRVVRVMSPEELLEVMASPVWAVLMKRRVVGQVLRRIYPLVLEIIDSFTRETVWSCVVRTPMDDYPDMPDRIASHFMRITYADGHTEERGEQKYGPPN